MRGARSARRLLAAALGLAAILAARGGFAQPAASLRVTTRTLAVSGATIGGPAEHAIDAGREETVWTLRGAVWGACATAVSLGEPVTLILYQGRNLLSSTPIGGGSGATSCADDASLVTIRCDAASAACGVIWRIDAL